MGFVKSHSTPRILTNQFEEVLSAIITIQYSVHTLKTSVDVSEIDMDVGSYGRIKVPFE